MASESKEAGRRDIEKAAGEAADDVRNEAEEKDEQIPGQDGDVTTTQKAKKKSKKGKNKTPLTKGMAEEVLEMNPALKNELAGGSEKPVDALKKLDVSQLLTGMVQSLFFYI